MESEFIQIKTRQGYFFNRIDIISKLGAGNFGAVFEMKWKQPNATGWIDIIPLLEASDEYFIARCIVHMQVKFGLSIELVNWKEYLPTDSIDGKCPDSAKYQWYCFIYFEDWGGVTAKDWIEVKKENRRLMDCGHYFYRKEIRILQGEFLLIFLNLSRVPSKHEDALKTSILLEDEMKMKMRAVKKTYALKIIKLPPEPDEQDKCIRECLILQKMKDGNYGKPIKKFGFEDDWKHILSGDFIQGIWADEEEEYEEEYTRDYWNPFSREIGAFEKSIIRASRTVHFHNAWKETLPMDFIDSIWSEEEEEDQETSSTQASGSFAGHSEKEEQTNNENENITCSTQGSDSFIKFEDSSYASDNSGKIQLRSATETKKQQYLFIRMKKCNKKSLRDWMQTNKVRKDVEVNWIFFKILLAVADIHSNGLIHRDIKPENIFFDREQLVVVGDLGLATLMHNDTRLRTDPNGCNGTAYEHTHGAGTSTYMSSEQLADKPYNHKVDIYALGVVLFELLVSFDTEMERRVNLVNLRKGIFPDNFHSKEYELLKTMLSSNPDERPEVKQVCARWKTAILRNIYLGLFIHDYSTPCVELQSGKEKGKHNLGW